MKRIMINALCLLVIVTGSTALGAQEESEAAEETNYQTCMRICREDGHSFTYCHGECKGLAEADAN